MANNYDHFAELIPDLTEEELAWVRKVLEPIEAEELEDYCNLLENEFEVKLDEEPDQDWPQFSWSIVHDNELLLTCDEHFNGDHIQWFMQAFLAKFRPGATFRMQWAWTCDKPRPGEFGGGWCMMTKDSCEWGSTWDSMNKLESRFLGRDLWKDNEIQFARLLCEIKAACNMEGYDKVLESMDLDEETADELWDRAEEVWEEAKERTRKHQAWAAAQKER